MTNVEWLKNLHGELYDFVRGYRGGYGHWREKRLMTMDEWTRFKEVLEDPNLFTSLSTSQFGFSLAIRVWEDAPYPGLDPTGIFWVGQKELPKELEVEGPTYGGSGASWNRAWDIFTKWTHSEENLRRLDFYKIKYSKSKSYYEY